MSAHPYVSEWRESRLQGMTTTLRKIRAAGPCGMQLEDGRRVGYLKLRHHLGKGYGDYTPVDIATILDSNGFDDALWCLRAVDGHAREKLLYAYWCARQVPSLMADPSSVTALDVAERNANGAAFNDELAAARAAGTEAAWAALAARAALGALAATDASWAALPAKEGARAALAAARDARDAARAAQAAELKRICAKIAAGRDPYPVAGVIA